MGAYAAQVGETVAVGAVIATIEDAQTAGETVQVAEREQAAAGRPGPARSRRRRRPRAAAGEDDHTTTLSPAVRRAVLEAGVDPSSIKGTGKDGRLTKEDVLAAAKAKEAAPAPAGQRRRPPLPRRPPPPPANGARSGSR